MHIVLASKYGAGGSVLFGVWQTLPSFFFLAIFALPHQMFKKNPSSSEIPLKSLTKHLLIYRKKKKFSQAKKFLFSFKTFFFNFVFAIFFTKFHDTPVQIVQDNSLEPRNFGLEFISYNFQFDKTCEIYFDTRISFFTIDTASHVWR